MGLVRRCCRVLPIIAAASLAGCASGVEDRAQSQVLFQSPDHKPTREETQALLNRADSLLENGSFDAAIATFKRAVTASDQDPEAVAALARAYLTLRRPEAALAQFDIAVVAHPNQPSLLIGRGVALDQLGRHGEAQESYKSAVAVAPEDSDTRAAASINLALSLAVSGNRHAATDLLKAVGRSGRWAVRARDNLALVGALGGDRVGATKLTAGDLDRKQASDLADEDSQLRSSADQPAEIPVR